MSTGRNIIQSTSTQVHLWSQRSVSILVRTFKTASPRGVASRSHRVSLYRVHVHDHFKPVCRDSISSCTQLLLTVSVSFHGRLRDELPRSRDCQMYAHPTPSMHGPTFMTLLPLLLLMKYVTSLQALSPGNTFRSLVCCRYGECAQRDRQPSSSRLRCQRPPLPQ